MRDQKQFMQQMFDLVNLAKTNDSTITKKEVVDFCGDLQLTDAQLKLVYDFLDEHNIEVVGHSGKKGFSASDGNYSEIGKEDPGLNTEDSKYLHLYRRELRGLAEVSAEERQRLYERLVSGDGSAKHPVIESHLKRVVTLAGKYKNRGVPLEDLIQEGNLTLITAVDRICGDHSIPDVKKELDRSVRATTNLIHEATKALAGEWGRLATVEELAEYTKMTEEEIQMYVELSLEEIQVGKRDVEN